MYGETQVAERHKTWDVLKFIKSSSPLPWMCIGDFNEVLHQHEHMGVAERSLGQIEGFRKALDVCELAYLGYVGNSWTYEKRVAGGSLCRVRLDRAVASAPWSTRFPMAIVSHLTGVNLDHFPIFLRWRESARQRRSTESKIFRYELMWEKHADFKPFLSNTWEERGKATSMQQLHQKLTDVSGSLENWGKTTFGNVQREIR
jgi:hypothetical protein